MNFHHFASIKKAININKVFLIKEKNSLVFFNDIILHWVVGLITKYRNILTNLYLHIHGLLPKHG